MPSSERRNCSRRSVKWSVSRRRVRRRSGSFAIDSQLTQDLQKRSASLAELQRMLERMQAAAQVYNPLHPELQALERELERKLEHVAALPSLAELSASQGGGNVSTE
jgi:hypothetical protein